VGTAEAIVRLGSLLVKYMRGAFHGILYWYTTLVGAWPVQASVAMGGNGLVMLRARDPLIMHDMK